MTEPLTARELSVVLSWAAARMDMLADLVPEVRKRRQLDLVIVELRTTATTLRGFVERVPEGGAV
jgi:hypothetical protein